MDLQKLREYPKFKDVEKNYLKELIKLCDGNAERAANVSGVSRATIYRKLKDFGISPKWFL